MHIPQQPPEDEQRRASQPLYEFVTDTSLRSDERAQEAPGALPNARKDDSQSPATSPEEGQTRTEDAPIQQSGPQMAVSGADRPPPSAEAIRQGLIYPPPPSFYQDVEESPAQPYSPSQAPGTAPFPAYRAGAQTPTPGTEYIVPPFIPVPPPVSAPRTSHKWMWIVIALLAGVLVLSCGLCSWAMYLFIAPTVQDETNALTLVNDYYDAIQARNYTAAYSYLAPSPQGANRGLTREQFFQQAQKRDSQYGPVHTYEPGQLSPTGTSNGSPGLNVSHLSITVNVTRAHLTYSTVLSLQKIGNSWKIVDFSSI